jgi:hypothetical protein
MQPALTPPAAHIGMKVLVKVFLKSIAKSARATGAKAW